MLIVLQIKFNVILFLAIIIKIEAFEGFSAAAEWT